MNKGALSGRRTKRLYGLRMPQTDFHENFTREESVVSGSDRSFGFVMSGALLLLGAFNGWHGGKLWPWLAFAAASFLTASLTRPVILNPLNGLWLKFGLLLHRIVNPVLMGLVFYCAVMPTGIIMRIRGVDLLRLKLERDSETYWIKRGPASPAAETMRDQF